MSHHDHGLSPPVLERLHKRIRHDRVRCTDRNAFDGLTRGRNRGLSASEGDAATRLAQRFDRLLEDNGLAYDDTETRYEVHHALQAWCYGGRIRPKSA